MEKRGPIARIGRGCLTYLLLGLVGIAVYYAVPARGAGIVVRIAVYLLLSASAAAMVWFGVARHRPRLWVPWLLFGLSQMIYAAADGTFYVAHYALDAQRFPSIADLLYLAHYPLLLAGLLLVIRRRTPGDVIGLLDGLILAVAVAMLSWLFIIQPTATNGDHALALYADLAYPIMDLALLAVAARLLTGGGRRSPAFVFLMVNLLGIGTADTIYSYQQLHGQYQAGNFLDGIWLAANLSLGAAALHPSMVHLAEPGRRDDVGLGPVRFLFLAAAALLAPATLLIQYARGVSEHVPATGLACVVLFLLTLGRMAGLAVEQRRLAITDPLTGLATRRFIEDRPGRSRHRLGRAVHRRRRPFQDDQRSVRSSGG
jgi:two-component system cell cycle response regulator